MEPIVGIDLGTTNSEVAYIINGNAEVLTDSDNGIVPSFVGLDPNGKIIVGKEARNQAVVAPDRTVVSVKRRMGEDTDIPMGDTTYRPQEISAFILKALKARAEKVIQDTVGKAVITVPAYFTDAQRQATREAGQIAGLEVVRIINEPTAAALAYESTQSESRRVMIYDLGGGTFDVSIVRIEEGVVEVLASTGDNHLGGDDFDQKIVDRLAEYAEVELKVNVRENRVLMARLGRAAEKAKIELSSQPYSRIEEDHIGKWNNQDVHLSYELSRDEFETLIEPELGQTRESVNKALNDAGILPVDIDRIILVGGSTRIPRIADMLEEKFKQRPHGEIDPDLCVALGAAIQAGREMGVDTSGVLLDITPYTFGTSAIGEVDGIPTPNMFVPLIRRNTKLPATRTEAFYTMRDNQEYAEINVHQGESPNALDNIRIGKYLFELTPAPRSSLLLLTYTLDINGILKIQALEKKTGRTIDGVIENALTYTEEELSASRDRISEAWGETEEETSGLSAGEAETTETPEETSLPPDIAEVLTRAEAALDSAADEDKEEIINLIEDIRDAVTAGEMADARASRQELEDILFYLG